MTTDHLEQTVEQRVTLELQALRSAVSGVDGCVVATSDGMLVAHVLPQQEQAQLAALVSTVAALGKHAVQIAGRGSLLEAAIRGSAGYMVVYALGDSAVLAVLGRSDLNIALLHLRTRAVAARLTELAPEFTGFAGPVPPPP